MLNKAWEEIAENKKQMTIAAEKAEASLAAAKEAASLHYEALLRKARDEASAQEANLSMTIHQLRSSLARESERAQWREEEFKKEIQVLRIGGDCGSLIQLSLTSRLCNLGCKQQRQEMRSWRHQFLILLDLSFVR